MSAFEHLFSPVKIGTMTAKNRLLMSAMSINFGVDRHGYVTDQLSGYFRARARGGVGMMLVGGGAVDIAGLELPDLPRMWENGCIPALKKMVDAVRPYDVRFGVQLMHGGRQCYREDKVAPSPLPALAVVRGVPRELSAPEIRGLAGAFGDAARRCREAGFDFVEIHAAHGYLINEFLSPNANRRTDEYGGSFENRIRFLLELMRDIRGKAGDDFPLGIRINGTDFIDGGWALEDAVRLAPLLEDAGAAYLHVSAGVYGSTQLTIPSMYVSHGCFLDLAEAVRRQVSLPVVAVGRIKSPEMADRIIREGRADVVAMGRALLADPRLPEKARSGRLDAIRPCIGCCLGCIHAVLAREPGSCVVNPSVGREHLLEDDEKAAVARTVLVVGAGPSGLAAARQAARCGHRVAVCDRRGESGGMLRLAATVPGRGEIADILGFFRRELERLKVPVRLNTEFTAALVDEFDPDAVILATGSLPEVPLVKGLSRTAMSVCTVLDVLEGCAVVGQRVIVLGGGQAGLTLADHLAESGRRVVVLHRGRHFAEEMSSNDRYYLRERLKAGKVRLFKQVRVNAFGARSVSFRTGGEPVTLEDTDSVVIADNMTAIREARNLLRGRGVELHFIGDAKKPRHLMYCISEAEEIGRSL